MNAFPNSQDLRSQLSQERDAIRHLALQKEIDVKELQGRVDKAVSAALILSW